MDAYNLVKFLHILSAVVWVGAGVGLVILGIAADQRPDKQELVRIIRNVMFMAPRVFMPASLATLVLGLIAAWLGWGFTSLWVWIGLVGFAATFCTGNFVLKPRAEKVGVIIAREGISDEAVAVGRELLQVSKFDYVMLFVVIADMVFKPGLADWLVLAVMAVAIIAAAVGFLVPVLRQPRVAVPA